MSDPLETAAKLVPDLYYDLIARVIPGGAALAAVVFSVPNGVLKTVHHDYKIWFLLFGGYLAGMLLTGASAVLFDLLLVGALTKVKPAWARAVGGREHYLVVERVSRSHPEQNVNIWKMVAEKVCFENGIVAVILLALLLPNTPAAAEVRSALPLIAIGAAAAWLLRTISLDGRIKAADEA